jgi:hypothetical protein
LPTPVGPEEQEAAHGAPRSLQPGAAAANRARQGGNGFVLADDALVQLDFDAQQFLLLVFLDRGDGDAGPARDHFFDVFARDDAGVEVSSSLSRSRKRRRFSFSLRSSSE